MRWNAFIRKSAKSAATLYSKFRLNSCFKSGSTVSITDGKIAIAAAAIVATAIAVAAIVEGSWNYSYR